MSRKIQIANNELYHIYNRGVEKRKVFMNKNDYLRFLKCLKEFNNKEKVNLKDLTSSNPRGSVAGVRKRKKTIEPLVDIICFCLMPNHFHIIVRQVTEGGIVLFMQKLSAGYTGYFNLKYERVGPLFQGAYKIKWVKNDAVLKHLVSYIHKNPIELLESNWKEKGIKNIKKALEFIELYKWSSYNDFIGKFSSGIINTHILDEIFDDLQNYKNLFMEILQRNYEQTLFEVMLD